jgi:hypothetical protein
MWPAGTQQPVMGAPAAGMMAGGAPMQPTQQPPLDPFGAL